MLQKHRDDMFSKEFDRNPRYFIQISAIFREVLPVAIIGCCGWKQKRDDGIVDGTTILFVFVSLKSVGNLNYHRGIHLSVAGARNCMGQAL